MPKPKNEKMSQTEIFDGEDVGQCGDCVNPGVCFSG